MDRSTLRSETPGRDEITVGAKFSTEVTPAMTSSLGHLLGRRGRAWR